jgi:hypothetical protein
MAATTEARVAKLEEMLEALAQRVADIIDDDVRFVWEEELVDEGTPDEMMLGDWNLRRFDGVALRMTCAIGGTEPIGGEVAVDA